MPIRIPSSHNLIAVVALLALVMGCSGDDGSDSSARVTALLFSAAVDTNGIPVNPAIAFPTGTREVFATVRLEGVRSGDSVTARWYQLGTGDAGAEGSEVNDAEVKLSADDLSENGAIVTFSQRAGASGLPEDAWLIRIYVGDTLVKTSAFVITSALRASAPAPAAAPSALPSVAAPQTYTVVAGDTIASIAQRFLPQGESITSYQARIVQVNNLPASPVLQVGQVIRIP
jgi:LysM repeat protein